jgi:hypothetical protein
MEAPFLPPVSAGLFWCLVFDVCGVADLQRPLAEGVHPMMPLFRLSPGEIEDVMAYLKTLR